jgi:hypothetical protein
MSYQHGKMISALSLQAKFAKCFYRKTSTQAKREKGHDHASFQHDVQGFAMVLIFVAFFRLEV